MKYVITGATSFIGLELIDILLTSGHTVIAVCRPSSKGRSKIPASTTIITADMSDYSDLDIRIGSADVFINLAWGGTGHDGRNVQDVQNENVKYSTSAIQVASRIGCKLFVEAGSQAEYGSTSDLQVESGLCFPFSEYGKAKLEVKNRGFELSEELGIKYLHLRIFSIFGENDHPWTLVMSALDKMLANEQVDLSPCTQNWNFVYVKDAVRMIMLLCDKAINSLGFKHEVYNIASKDTRELKKFVERMKQLSNSTSLLNYGTVVPLHFVSLQPDMTKTLNDIQFDDFHSFDDVIYSIIENKRITL